VLRLQGAAPVWGVLFFLGLAIGLLAKGPLALVLPWYLLAEWKTPGCSCCWPACSGHLAAGGGTVLHPGRQHSLDLRSAGPAVPRGAGDPAATAARPEPAGRPGRSPADPDAGRGGRRLDAGDLTGLSLVALARRAGSVRSSGEKSSKINDLEENGRAGARRNDLSMGT
jgi:hypothetical protein